MEYANIQQVDEHHSILLGPCRKHLMDNPHISMSLLSKANNNNNNNNTP